MITEVYNTVMANLRNAAVAGQFYAGEAETLQHDVDSLLQASRTDAQAPKVVVAPHAGYIYSGPVAAQVYARLANARPAPTRVVLLGPSHRVAFAGIATSSASHFATPLGDIPVDQQSLRSIASLPGVQQRDDAHALEHSLEVHLPFLQRSLGHFQLVPLVVGDAAPHHVAQVIDALWGDQETVIVVSSDLSHYLPYRKARHKDAGTQRLIEARQPVLTGDQACGCRPLNGLLTVLRQRRLDIETVAVLNSGDTAGDHKRVVGYGAWAVNEQRREPPLSDPDVRLTLAQRQQLLHAARHTISTRLAGPDLPALDSQQYDPALSVKRSSFVTLKSAGRLRGCIGSLIATRSLLLDVVHNAAAAAFQDPRFKPLHAAEFAGIELHISVLSQPQPVAVASRAELLTMLQPGKHGLILQTGKQRATYLPSVWETLPEPEQFVRELRAKAGLPREGWSDNTQVSIYHTEEFS